MGDRALIQLRTKEDVSPVLYMHNGGGDVGDILHRTKMRMGNRSDLSYTFARLVQEATMDDRGNTSFGVWNSPLLEVGDSHGDAGVFVVDISEPEWLVYIGGGYGFEGIDTNPGGFATAPL